MAIAIYLSPIVGTGTIDDPYRPKVADYGVSWVGLISVAPGPNGPARTWSLVIVNTASTATIDADTAIAKVPSANPDDLISSFTRGTRNRMQSELDARGIALTVDSFATVGDLVNAIGRHFEPTFDLAAIAVG